MASLRCKVDENLPVEVAQLLRDAGFDADTVWDEQLAGSSDTVLADRCQVEGRLLLTLDLDFSNTIRYPPSQYPGFVVFRTRDQSKPALIEMARRLLPLMAEHSPQHQLWVVSDSHVRVRT